MGAYIQSLGLSTAETLKYYEDNFQVDRWLCEEASGNLVGSVNSTVLTLAGTPDFQEVGLEGDYAVELKANGDYWYRQNTDICPDATEDWYASFYFKDVATPSPSNVLTLASNLSGANPNVFMQTNAGYARLGYNNATVATVFANTGVDVRDGTWQHVAYGLKIVNGRRRFTATVDGVLTALIYQNTPDDLSGGYFSLGRLYSTNTAQAFIDDLRIFKGVGAFPNDSVIQELITFHD